MNTTKIGKNDMVKSIRIRENSLDRTKLCLTYYKDIQYAGFRPVDMLEVSWYELCSDDEDVYTWQSMGTEHYLTTDLKTALKAYEEREVSWLPQKPSSFAKPLDEVLADYKIGEKSALDQTLKVINVEKRIDDYLAYANSDPRIWACGKTYSEAIGTLISAHAHQLQIVIHG